MKMMNGVKKEHTIKRIQKAQLEYDNKTGNTLFVVLLTLAILTVGVLAAVTVEAREVTRNGVTVTVPDLHPNRPTYTPSVPVPPAAEESPDNLCAAVFGYVPNVLQPAHSGDYIAADGSALTVFGSGGFATLRFLETGGTAWYEGMFEFGSDVGPRIVQAPGGGNTFATVLICGGKFADCNQIHASVSLPGGVSKTLFFVKEHTYDGDTVCLD